MRVKSVVRFLVSCLLFVCVSMVGVARELPKKMTQAIDSIVVAGLNAGYYPGASIAIGNHAGIIYENCYGFQDHTKRVRVATEDIYDLASVTKIVATTTIIMQLYDQGRIDLNHTVGDYISHYDSTEVATLTLTQLLTHTSGLPYFPVYSLLFENPTGSSLISTRRNPLYPQQVDRAAYLCADPLPVDTLIAFQPVTGSRRAGEGVYINPVIDVVIHNQVINSYRPNLRGRYNYSDTNFYILRQIVEKITGKFLDELTAELFESLQMYTTGYNPLEWKSPQMIIPTEYDYLLQRGELVGYVHDDLAASSGGVEGNAGLFSNARDLANYCRMMLNNGEFDDKRIVSKEAIQLFTDSPLSPRRIYRGLGFDKRKSDSDLGNGYGHTGYTGTLIWIDPESDIFFIFLCNRVNPTRLNRGLSSSEIRTEIWKLLTK